VPAEVNAVLLAAIAIGTILFFNQLGFFGPDAGRIGAAIFIIQFGVLIPAQIAGEQLAQRRPRIAFEMLLPVSRRQLVDGLFAASIRNAATMWLLLHAAMGFVLLVTEIPVAARTIAVFALLSAATTLAMAGVSMRLAVWPSMAKRIIVLILAWGALLPPLLVWVTMHDKANAPLFVAFAITLAGVGMWALHAARRAWLNLEFV
jgi:hypothetical protein